MKKKVLFLCPGNSCSSQMAEGLLKHFHGDKYEVFSAGVKPVEVNKGAVQVMKEIGVDISKQTSKNVNDFLNQNFDIIITVCSEQKEKYPSFLDKALIQDWGFFDPAEKLDAQNDLMPSLRELRDGIKEKISKHFN